MRTWVVISQAACPWCDKVINLLEDRGHVPKIIKLKAGGKLADFVAAIGLRTVPQVWHNGVHIGGYEATKQYVESFHD